MAINKDVLFELIEKSRPTELIIGEKSRSVEKITVSYSGVPVNRPTIRGGVYHADTMAFKAKATISNSNISKLLSGAMLGPNPDFEKIHLVTTLDTGKKFKMLANLTNYVEKANVLELNLIIIETDLES